MKKMCLLISTIAQLYSQAQITPEISSWVFNLDSSRGYGNLLSNVQKVQYSASNVYVSCTCIPGYDIGPWTGNPNTPANQNFCFKITRNPQKNSGTATTTPLGHVGVWSNGVSIFNAKDAMSYGNKGFWNQNAITVEGPSFDTCLGHPAPNGEYHHHLIPRCLFSYNNVGSHSPIIGYAFDGFPIYGPYAYSDTNGMGTIRRMESSYRLRNITQRHTLPDGTTLLAANYGPDVSSTYILGYYLEDYEYVAGLGDLDEHNGRFCKTPEYPNGTYAYFVTIDSLGVAAYPYTVGLTYYGTVPTGNTGPGSGHNTPSEAVTTYTPAGTAVTYYDMPNKPGIYPNPASDEVFIKLNGWGKRGFRLSITDPFGKNVKQLDFDDSKEIQIASLMDLMDGIYFLSLESKEKLFVQKLVISRK